MANLSWQLLFTFCFINICALVSYWPIDHFRITLRFPRTITRGRGFVPNFHTFSHDTKPQLQVIVHGNVDWNAIRKWSIKWPAVNNVLTLKGFDWIFQSNMLNAFLTRVQKLKFLQQMFGSLTVLKANIFSRTEHKNLQIFYDIYM